MIGRLVQAADFRRLLATPVRRRSTHFALHYLRAPPTLRVWLHAQATGKELSTGDEQTCPDDVDDFGGRRWLGCLVPKRHARRSVTRSTLKRQIRAAVQRHQGGLPAGIWLVRLRAPFLPARFPSADSGALRKAARLELDGLLAPTSPAPPTPP